MLAKAAHGIADDLLSTTILSSELPVFFVPSMNSSMWHRPVVQRNVELLRRDGHHVVCCSDAHDVIELNSGARHVTELMPSPSELLATADAYLSNHHRHKGD
jgi:phosphopantothenoylcysteine synthetase/decarboxylase